MAKHLFFSSLEKVVEDNIVTTEGYSMDKIVPHIQKYKTIYKFENIDQIFNYLSEILADTHFFVSMSNRVIEIRDDKDENS